MSELENVRIWKRQNLNLSEFELVRIWKCQNPSKPDNVRIWKSQNFSKPENVQILTFSDPDIFRFWHFPDLTKNGFWRFQILTCSCFSARSILYGHRLADGITGKKDRNFLPSVFCSPLSERRKRNVSNDVWTYVHAAAAAAAARLGRSFSPQIRHFSDKHTVLPTTTSSRNKIARNSTG